MEIQSATQLKVYKQQTSLINAKSVDKPLYFGGQEVSNEYVFIMRRYCFAMVNPKPVTDGHVLVCPTR